MRLWLDAMWGIIRRDAILFVSYRTQLVSQVLGPLFAIALFYYISQLLTVKTVHSSGGYFGYVIVGLVIVEILTLSLGLMPVSVRQELVSGTIERFLVSAHGPVNGIFGTMLFPLFNAFLSGVAHARTGHRDLRASACRDLLLGDPRCSDRRDRLHAVFGGPRRNRTGVQAGGGGKPVHRRPASRSSADFTFRSRCCRNGSAGPPKPSLSRPPRTSCAISWWVPRLRTRQPWSCSSSSPFRWRCSHSPSCSFVRRFAGASSPEPSPSTEAWTAPC